MNLLICQFEWKMDERPTIYNLLQITYQQNYGDISSPEIKDTYFIYIYIYICFHGCKIGRWLLRCPAYLSGTGKDGFRIDVSIASQSSVSRSVPAATWSRNKLRQSNPIQIPWWCFVVPVTNLDHSGQYMAWRVDLFAGWVSVSPVRLLRTFDLS